MSETALSKSIRQALTVLGCVVWKQNAHGFRARMQGAPAGTPDIVGYMPDGRMLAIEVKAPKGKERPAQTAWLAKAKAAGCVVGTVRSVDEAVTLVQRARKEAAA